MSHEYSYDLMMCLLKVMKAATNLAMLFHRSSEATLDVTDDHSERPWSHAYVEHNLLTLYD